MKNQGQSLLCVVHEGLDNFYILGDSKVFIKAEIELVINNRWYRRSLIKSVLHARTCRPCHLPDLLNFNPSFDLALVCLVVLIVDGELLARDLLAFFLEIFKFFT